MELTEILKAAGLDDDKITEVTEQMATNKIFTTSEENVETRLAKFKEQRDEAVTAKEALETEKQALSEENDGFKTQIQDLTTKQEELEAKAGSDDESKTQIEELQKQLEEAQNTNVNMTKQQKLKEALQKVGALDADYVGYKAFGKDPSIIDLDDDGSIKGFDEKINEFKEANPKYFADSEEKVVGSNGLLGDNKPATVDPFERIRAKYN